MFSLFLSLFDFRLAAKGPGFDSQRYQIFWEVMGLKWGPLSFVRITEELLERTVAAPVNKTEINGRGDSLRWPRDTLYQLKLALTSPTNGGRSVGIVRWQTKTRIFLKYSGDFIIFRPALKITELKLTKNSGKN
jgi:hypothetical protein